MINISWREAYKNAVMEMDSAKLPERIEMARVAIHERLNKNSEPLSKRELDDLEGALRTLTYLTKQAA
jgi:hypothetical protein